MAFDSALFGWFMLLVFLASWAARRLPALRLGILLGASYAFYAAWDPKLLLLIVFSTALDYVVGHALHASPTAWGRRAWLWVSLTGNLGLLGVFKYAGFARDSLQGLLDALASGTELPVVDLVLPVGISFYTFQTLSYTIDIYRGTLQPARSFARFALFVVFFPQLVAGPIVRAADFLPQLDKPPSASAARHGYGLFLMVRGLVKKVAVADVLARSIVDRVFDSPELYSSLEVAVAVYAYAVQIYADFSGYSDLAIGAAALLGYRLTENFRRPYVSTNLQEFWRRWHVSLSTWLRDYLYVPLGGNRGTSLATYRNLMITMLLGGLWHGAAWTFVIWGALHGAGLAVVRWWQRRRGGRLETGRWRRVAASVATFHFVCFAWIFFRSQSLDGALAVLGVLGEGTFRVTNLDREIVGTTFGMIVLHMLPRRWVDGAGRAFAKMPSWLQALLVVAALVAVSRAHGGSRPFAYFQF